MSVTYELYLELRRQCGYDGGLAMIQQVWDGCEPDAQKNMLDQLRIAAAARRAELDKFGGDHW